MAPVKRKTDLAAKNTKNAKTKIAFLAFLAFLAAEQLREHT
jgi:hypothetical protein